MTSGKYVAVSFRWRPDGFDRAREVDDERGDGADEASVGWEGIIGSIKVMYIPCTPTSQSK